MRRVGRAESGEERGQRGRDQDCHGDADRDAPANQAGRVAENSRCSCRGRAKRHPMPSSALLEATRYDTTPYSPIAVRSKPTSRSRQPFVYRRAACQLGVGRVSERPDCDAAGIEFADRRAERGQRGCRIACCPRDDGEPSRTLRERIEHDRLRRFADRVDLAVTHARRSRRRIRRRSQPAGRARAGPRMSWQTSGSRSRPLACRHDPAASNSRPGQAGIASVSK